MCIEKGMLALEIIYKTRELRCCVHRTPTPRIYKSPAPYKLFPNSSINGKALESTAKTNLKFLDLKAFLGYVYGRTVRQKKLPFCHYAAVMPYAAHFEIYPCL